MRMNKTLKIIILCTFVLSLAVIATACMPGDGYNTAARPAGFLWGIWHGWIAPLSLIFGLFNHTSRIYEVNNTGLWYDFGFYIAVISGFGGVALFRSKK